MSIKDNLLKIKSFSWVFLCLGIATASFISGRISVLAEDKTPIVLGVVDELVLGGTFQPASVGNIFTHSTSKDEQGIVVASKQGKSYHFPWCSGAQRISPENKITFASRIEAEKAGYVPAKNCKGLVDPTQ